MYSSTGGAQGTRGLGLAPKIHVSQIPGKEEKIGDRWCSSCEYVSKVVSASWYKRSEGAPLRPRGEGLGRPGNCTRAIPDSGGLSGTDMDLRVTSRRGLAGRGAAPQGGKDGPRAYDYDAGQEEAEIQMTKNQKKPVKCIKAANAAGGRIQTRP